MRSFGFGFAFARRAKLQSAARVDFSRFDDRRARMTRSPKRSRRCRAMSLMTAFAAIFAFAALGADSRATPRLERADEQSTGAAPRGDVIAIGANEFELWKFLNADDGVETAMVEFYMPWCGHCQQFAPQYALAASAVKGKMKSYAVDCVANGATCGAFALTGYPSVLLGTKREFGEAAKTLKKFSGAHRAGDVVKWIDKELGSTFSRDGLGAEVLKELGREEQRLMIASATTTSVASATYERADLADLERATIEIYAQMTSEAVFSSTLEAREAFVNFWTLAAAAHPVEQCHRGLTNALNALETSWPRVGAASTREIRIALTSDVRVCGKARGEDSMIVPRWSECAGSVEGSRGYTCGVWTLLHALAARTPTSPGITNASFIRALQGWVRHFFPCDECRKHFLSLLSNPETSFDEYIDRADGASMWLWKAHNLVNARLATEYRRDGAKIGNASGVGVAVGAHDPKFPKVQFPTKSSCPRCYVRAETGGEEVWDEIRVSEFLQEYYLANGARREMDLKASTQTVTHLVPMAADSSLRPRGVDDATATSRETFQQRREGMSVYDVFFMSTRFFLMFALILFMCVKAGVLSASQGAAKKSPSRFSPSASAARDVGNFKNA